MAAPPPQFRFGDFAWICDRASLTVCPALGLGDPQCYSRNIGIKSFLLFQPCNSELQVSQASSGACRQHNCPFHDPYNGNAHKEQVHRCWYYFYFW